MHFKANISSGQLFRSFLSFPSPPLPQLPAPISGRRRHLIELQQMAGMKGQQHVVPPVNTTLSSGVAPSTLGPEVHHSGEASSLSSNPVKNSAELEETDEQRAKKKSELDKKKKKVYALGEFFDRVETWGKYELSPVDRPGRHWTIDELRTKSNTDLHKLWYVLLKERNMLLTMEHAYRIRAKYFPNPERLDRVKLSMDNIEAVVHERNDAFLSLETGQGAGPPMRTVTSFAGFTYEDPAREHYDPFEKTGEKEYEIPYLDDDAYVMQKLWAEKAHLKAGIEAHDKWMESQLDVKEHENLKLRNIRRRHFNRLGQLPPNALPWPMQIDQQHQQARKQIE